MSRITAKELIKIHINILLEPTVQSTTVQYRHGVHGKERPWLACLKVHHVKSLGGRTASQRHSVTAAQRGTGPSVPCFSARETQNYQCECSRTSIPVLIIEIAGASLNATLAFNLSASLRKRRGSIPVCPCGEITPKFRKFQALGKALRR